MEWDVICGTEIWRAEDEEELDLPSGHLFVGAGGVKGSRGVGFLVHRRWKAGFKAFYAKSERVGVLDITIAGVALRLIVVYMPHTGYSDEEVESVYQTVGEARREGARQKRRVAVGGDFNAVVGKWVEGECLKISWARETREERRF